MDAIKTDFGEQVPDDVVAFNRTSCALSNFPDEHHLSKEYHQVILRDIAAAWLEFSLAANRLLLAKADAHTLAVIGTGKQSRTQIAAVCAVRPITRVKVFSRTAEHREAYARSVEKELGVEVLAAPSAQASSQRSSNNDAVSEQGPWTAPISASG